MSKIYGVCQSCGSHLDDVFLPCSSCQFDPIGKVKAAGTKSYFYRALVLSEKCKDFDDLERISSSLKAGIKYEFSEAELLQAERETRFPWGMVIKNLLPLAALLLGLYFLYQLFTKLL